MQAHLAFGVGKILLQNHAEDILRRIRVDNERFADLGVSQDWMCRESFLYQFKRLFFPFSPLNLSSFLGGTLRKVSKRECKVREFLDILPVVRCKVDEAANIRNCARGG